MSQDWCSGSKITKDYHRAPPPTFLPETTTRAPQLPSPSRGEGEGEGGTEGAGEAVRDTDKLPRVISSQTRADVHSNKQLLGSASNQETGLNTAEASCAPCRAVMWT